jgi:hypothetical protein
VVSFASGYLLKGFPMRAEQVGHHR